MDRKKLNNILEIELENHNKWKDPYDAEAIKNRIIRGVSKRVALFINSPFYTLKIFKNYKWDENYILIGLAALNMDNKELVKKCMYHLKIPNKKYWGLPIAWHSGEYIFPPGTIMSTTTAECILFLVKAREKYPELVSLDYLETVSTNLINSLKKNYLSSSGDEYLFSYTDNDNYKVFNSNILVAAAIGSAGKVVSNSSLISTSKKIIAVCDKYIPEEGFIPYQLHGPQRRNDAYHQLFSMRGLIILKHYKVINDKILNRVFDYFDQSLFHDGMIKMKSNKEVYDFQPYSEALRYYGLIGDQKKYNEIFNTLNLFKKNDSYIQKVWVFKNKPIKANVCYHRQGLLRFYLGNSYRTM